MASLTEVLDFIANRSTQGDLDRIHDFTRNRTKVLRSLRAATVTVDTTVTIKNIKPAGLAGLTGRVTNITNDHAAILLDKDSTDVVRFGRTRHAARIAANCDNYLLGGIPLVCLDPVSVPA